MAWTLQRDDAGEPVRYVWDNPALTPVHFVQVQQHDPPMGGWVHTCLICGVSGPEPPTLPCFGPAVKAGLPARTWT